MFAFARTSPRGWEQRMRNATDLSGAVSGRAEHHRQLLMSVGEAMRSLAIGRTKFYQLVANGEIEAVKQGSKTCVVVASAVAYVERLRAAAHTREGA